MRALAYPFSSANEACKAKSPRPIYRPFFPAPASNPRRLLQGEPESYSVRRPQSREPFVSLDHAWESGQIVEKELNLQAELADKVRCRYEASSIHVQSSSNSAAPCQSELPDHSLDSSALLGDPRPPQPPSPGNKSAISPLVPTECVRFWQTGGKNVRIGQCDRCHIQKQRTLCNEPKCQECDCSGIFGNCTGKAKIVSYGIIVWHRDCGA